MSIINLRSNNPNGLTNAQIDANFTNLNNDKVETTDCTSINLGNRVVKRDSSGDFAARIITAESISLTGDLVVSGGLTVNGTVTTINSTTMSVDDKNIELGSVVAPTDQTALGGGITLKGSADKTIIWDANGNWSSSEDWNILAGKSFKIANVPVLNSTTLGSSVVSSSLTSVGAISSGSWNATTIAPVYGGTGLTSYAKGDILYSSATNILSKLSAGADGQVLKMANGTPAWGADINVTYSLDGSGTNNSVDLELVASGSVTGTDKINLVGNDATTVIWDEANQRITISSHNTTYSKASSTTLGLVELGSDTLQTIAPNAVTATNGRSYAVQLNSDNQMVVNVPWVDTDTVYTAGNGLTLSGTTFNVGVGSYIIVDADAVAVDASTANTVSKIVARDSAGNFAAGTITADLTGNASTATTWKTARTITLGATGKSLNGSANVTWTLAEIGAYAATNPNGYTANTGTVTSIIAGTGLSGGTITTAGTIALADTAVVPGSYTTANITVDAQGRITAASNGSGGAGGAIVTDDTSTDATRYLVWEDITSGPATTMGVSSSKLTFNPSTGTLSSTTFNSLSDENVKTNISVVTDALSVVTSLNGVEFNWKDNGKKSSGVIAQQLEQILPHLVDTNDGIKSVNYSGIIGYLIEAIKELNVRINELEGA